MQSLQDFFNKTVLILTATFGGSYFRFEVELKQIPAHDEIRNIKNGYYIYYIFRIAN
jgi:hypothetical protein